MFTHLIRRSSLALALALAPLSLAAQELPDQPDTPISPFCTGDTARGPAALVEALVGHWEVNVTNGLATQDGNAIKLPPTAFPAVMFTVGDGLGITFETGDVAGATVDLHFEIDQGWNLETPFGDTGWLSEEGFSASIGCRADTLPRLTGSADFASGAGPATLSVYFYVIDTHWMYGVMRADAVNGLVLRQLALLTK